MGDEGRTRIYGRNPVREAERGRRRVHRIWTSEDTEPAELTRLAGSPDHQGIVAEVDPYPYADPASLLREPDALVVALDQIQDPRNLGAICRSAEAAGAAGVIICERRAAGITAAACKASAGAVEHLPIAHVRNLTDWIGTAKGSEAWVYGADGEAETGYRNPRLRGEGCAGARRRGRGSAARGLRRRAISSSRSRRSARSARSTCRPPPRCSCSRPPDPVPKPFEAPFAARGS